MKRQILVIAVLITFLPSVSAAANVTNVTLQLTMDADDVYIDGESIDADSYTDTVFEYPYVVTDQPAGIVSYSRALEIGYENLTRDRLRVVQEKGSFLVPFTEGSHNSIENSQELVQSRDLLNQLDPSFSFFMPENPVVKVSYLFQHQVAEIKGDPNNINQLSVRNRLNGKNFTELTLQSE